MPKVLLLSFDVESREPRRKDLEEAGFSVATEEPAWPTVLTAAKRFKPHVIAVDCGQLPARCREAAEALRGNAATNGIPVVLFRVAEHEVERTRMKVPGGVVSFGYELVDRIRSAAITRLAHLAALGPRVGGQHTAPAVCASPAPSPPEAGSLPSVTKKSTPARESLHARKASACAAAPKSAAARTPLHARRAPLAAKKSTRGRKH